MGITIEPNYFVEVFRCCEDCKLYPTCKNAGYGCCNYKLYEPEDDKEENDSKGEEMRVISVDELIKHNGDHNVVVDSFDAIPKDQYEARLKADMVAMLEELKKEIIELPFPQREPEYMQGYSYCQMNILDDVIQEKIDKLRGDENE